LYICPFITKICNARDGYRSKTDVFVVKRIEKHLNFISHGFGAAKPISLSLIRNLLLQYRGIFKCEFEKN
jgi:hypothetical protein